MSLPLRSASLLVATLGLAATYLQAQEKLSPTEQLARAHATYYTPTASGLQGFRCDVAIDWKDLITRVTGKPVADDDPFLTYLNSVKLSVVDNLRGQGEIQWNDTTAPPADLADRGARMHRGLTRMFGGFFQTWNVFMNGEMVPIPDSSVTVTRTAEGIRMHGDPKGMHVDEFFDKNILLTEAHVATDAADVEQYPTYTDTPEGRLVTFIRSTYRQPPTAPPADMSMRVEYAKVASFQLPETLTIDERNVGIFVFKFSACTVTAQPTPRATP